VEKRKGPNVSELERRRYVERGIDRQRLLLRIDRELAARLRIAAAAQRVSMNAFVESLLAGHLTGARRDVLDLAQPADRERFAASPAEPPQGADNP
jgi:hypothetical protein